MNKDDEILRDLISAAAEAQERFGDDELERFANALPHDEVDRLYLDHETIGG